MLSIYIHISKLNILSSSSYLYLNDVTLNVYNYLNNYFSMCVFFKSNTFYNRGNLGNDYVHYTYSNTIKFVLIYISFKNKFN